MDVKNMTAAQIAAMSLEEFNSLTAAEAKQALAKVRRSVNQRLRRLHDELDYSSPALERMRKSGGEHLKPASKVRNENMAELKRGIDFLNMKTATVKGARQHFSQVKKDVGLSDSVGHEEAKDIYKKFHKLQEEYGGQLSKESGKEKYEALKRRIGKWSEEGLSDDEIKSRINTFYERSAAAEDATAAEILEGIEKDAAEKARQAAEAAASANIQQ